MNIKLKEPTQLEMAESLAEEINSTFLLDDGVDQMCATDVLDLLGICGLSLIRGGLASEAYIASLDADLE